jgi:hypothetical protein
VRRLRPHRAWRVDWCRGLAHDCLDRGADGVYVFNWHGHRDTHRPLLTTMGSQETLRGLDKVSTALLPQRRAQDGQECGCGAG